VAKGVERALTVTPRRSEVNWPLAVAAAVLCVVTLAPLLLLVPELWAAGSASLGVWTLPRTWLLLGASIGIAGAVTLLSIVVGIPLGLAWARMDVPGRGVAWMLHAFAFFLPPFSIALGWFHVFGRQGWLGSPTSSSWLFSATGLVGVLGFAFAPVVTSLVALGVMNVDPALEDAARVVARPWRVATRILLPAAQPAVMLAALIVFALALSELGAPMFLRVDVFQAAVFARLGGVDHAPGEAIALVLPLLPISLLLLWLERRTAGRKSYEVLGLRGASRTPLALGALRIPVIVFCWFSALVSVAPVLALVTRAINGDGVSGAVEWIGLAPQNGLLAAGCAASVILLLGVVIGHAAARRGRGGLWLDALAVFAFVVPAPVIGIGLIRLWNRPATQLVYGTLAILVLGFTARYAVLGIRVFASTVAQIPVHTEEAAAVAGAGPLRRLTRIVLPIGARGAAAAWLLAAVFGLRDLETAVLFYPAGGEPLSVRIFTLEANGPQAVVAGLAAIHAGIIALVLVAGAPLLVRGRR
jgi:iron(III) transport system permease protein